MAPVLSEVPRSDTALLVAPHLVFSLHGELTALLLRALGFPFWRTVVRSNIWARGVLTATGVAASRSSQRTELGNGRVHANSHVHTHLPLHICIKIQNHTHIDPSRSIPTPQNSLLMAPFSNIEKPTSHYLASTSFLVHLQRTQDEFQTSSPTAVRDSCSH